MFNITTHYSGFIAILFIAVSVAAALFFYKNSTLPKGKKYLLISLKSLAFFLILVLFLEPSILSFIHGDNENPDIVLIDNTRSMNLPSGTSGQKKQEVTSLLKGKTFSSNDYVFYSFSNKKIEKIKPERFDSLTFNGFETDPESALHQLKELYPENTANSVILVSDGDFNSGGNPVYESKLFGCPFTAIGIGDTVQRKDLVIDNVYYNQKALTDAVNPIKAVINTYELPAGTININLYREGVLISTKTIDIMNSAQSSEVNFEVTEDKPGTVKYRLTADEVPGELTYLNNTRDFLIDYIENKLNILFISAGPGYDNSFLTDILTRIKNYHTIVRTVKNPEEFYEGPIDYRNFGELSAVFLLGFPTSQFSGQAAGTLASKINEYHIPLIFFAGMNTDYKKLNLFDELIPFSITGISGSENLFTPRIVSGTENSFSQSISDMEKAPQIFTNIKGVQQKAGSEVLITDKASGEPVFITRNTGRNRSSAFLGYGIWRWRLNPNTDYEKLAQNFIMETVNSVVQKEKRKKLQVHPEKPIFDYTERIQFSAEVYDENYSPVSNAEIKGKLIKNGETVKENIPFILSGNKYSAELPPLPAGDYTLEAEAELNNIYYASDNARFLADTINTEYLVTKSNFENLRILAENTAGKFFTSKQDNEQISGFLASIKSKDKGNYERSAVKQFNLWENKYVLLFIIALFAAEWYIRKRSNLP